MRGLTIEIVAFDLMLVEIFRPLGVHLQPGSGAFKHTIIPSRSLYLPLGRQTYEGWGSIYQKYLCFKDGIEKKKMQQ